MNKILHISYDEKFIPGVMNYFQTFRDIHNEIIVLKKKDADPRFVLNAQEYIHIRNPSELQVFVDRIHANSYQLIIFHGIDLLQAAILINLNQSQKVLWMYLGFEIYNLLPEFRCHNYGTRTRNLLHEESRFKREFKKWIHYKLGHFAKAPASIQQVRKAMKRVHWFGSFLSEDWDYIQSKMSLNAMRLPTCFYDLESIVSVELWDQYVSGTGVFLGNSATPENNHLEAIESLQRLDNGNMHVVCPLSYGVESYASAIEIAGKNAFGERIRFLKTFMSRDEYNRIMLECPIVVMNHYRQQAVGNVITALWLGAKLYMSEKSTVYQYFKNRDYKIYAVETDLAPTNRFALEALSLEDRIINRQKLVKEFSKDVVLQNYEKSMLEMIHES